MQATGREFLVLVRPFLVPFADANERGLKKRVHGKDSGDLGACFEVGGGGDSTGAIPRRQAVFYPVIFIIHRKSGGGGMASRPPLFRGP
jgi:hypothetical protein